jgi:hypothetical protein
MIQDVSQSTGSRIGPHDLQLTGIAGRIAMITIRPTPQDGHASAAGTASTVSCTSKEGSDAAAPLGLTDAEDHALAVDVLDPQGHDLGDPQAGGVGGHEDGAVLHADDGREETGDLLEAEDDGELLRLLGAGDVGHDPLPAEGDLVEEPEARDGLVEAAPAG